MPGLNYSTPLYPTDCEGPLTPGATTFEPSVISILGTAGSVTVTTAAGHSVTFSAVQPGWDLPVLCVAVTAASATGIYRSF